MFEVVSQVSLAWSPSAKSWAFMQVLKTEADRSYVFPIGLLCRGPQSVRRQGWLSRPLATSIESQKSINRLLKLTHR
jgi:hypothetical protein